MNRLISGLALAGIFGWILAFPMFGRFLYETAGDQAGLAGLLFALSHGAALLVLHRIPLRVATNPLWVRSAGGLIVLTSTLFAWAVSEPGIYQPGLVQYLIWMVILGVSAAFLVLAWVPAFTRRPDPLLTLLVAMPGANLIVALVSLPVLFPSLPAMTLLALLPLASAHLIGRSLRDSETEVDRAELSERVARLAPARSGRIRELAVFAVAVYFAGGLWYSQIASVDHPWAASSGALITAAVVAGLALLHRQGRADSLVLYTITLLGVGLLVSSEWLGLLWAAPVYSALLLAGFAAGDLHFWNQLCVIGAGWDGRRTFGLGLGGSLLLIALAGLVPSSGWAALLLAHPSSSTVSAMLLFLVIPLLYSTRRDEAPPVVHLGGVQTPRPPVPPGDLTRAEVQVWDLLINGATDPEIAAVLGISRHTAKFHVRNVLHKAGASNRKELLANLLSGPTGPAGSAGSTGSTGSSGRREE